MRCEMCGQANTPDANFCCRCGAPFQRPETAPTQMLGVDPLSGEPGSNPLTRGIVGASLVLLAAGVIVGSVIALANRGGGSNPTPVVFRTATAPTTAAPSTTTATPATTSPTVSTATTTATVPTLMTPTTTRTTRATTRTPTQTTTAYRGAAFDAQVPRGWKMVENDQSKGAFTESKWHNGGHASTLLVDFQPTSGLSPRRQGAPVRRQVRQDEGYVEANWGPGNLTGRPSWRWIFTVPGEGTAVDYFFTRCGRDYAVLGTAPPSQFGRLVGKFTTFADSLSC